MQTPTTFGLWYVVGRGVGAVTLRAFDLGAGVVLGACEAAASVRRFLHR